MYNLFLWFVGATDYIPRIRDSVVLMDITQGMSCTKIFIHNNNVYENIERLQVTAETEDMSVNLAVSFHNVTINDDDSMLI